jgi:hypothetical protein
MSSFSFAWVICVGAFLHSGDSHVDLFDLL